MGINSFCHDEWEWELILKSQELIPIPIHHEKNELKWELIQ